MRYYHDITQLIGKTPLVRIRRINPYPAVTVLAKLEKMNPGGSVKDRVAKYMIEQAEDSGDLDHSKVVIEATSGNTGIGIAMLCALKGYSCEIVMPESMSVERRRILESYGATVVLTSAELGINGAQDYVQQKVRECPERYYHPNQYDNLANTQAHYETTAVEILEDTDYRVTHFVAGLGTSGTLMGVGRRLREELDDIKIVSVEPKTGSFIQGIKDLDTSHVPKIFDEDMLDIRVRVNEGDAEDMATRLSIEEGLSSGYSSGAAMCGALKIAEHAQNESNVIIVVLFADSGEKYLSSMTVPAQQECEDTVTAI